jgi:hypothetical protein
LWFIDGSFVDNTRLRAFLKDPLLKVMGFTQLEQKPAKDTKGTANRHCHLKEHAFKQVLVDSAGCDGCKQAPKMASHVLCDCEAIAVVRCRHLGCYFLKPGDFADISVSSVLHCA